MGGYGRHGVGGSATAVESAIKLTRFCVASLHVLLRQGRMTGCTLLLFLVCNLQIPDLPDEDPDVCGGGQAHEDRRHNGDDDTQADSEGQQRKGGVAVVKQEVAGEVAPCLPSAADGNGATADVKSEPASAGAVEGNVTLEADERLENMSPPPADLNAAAEAAATAQAAEADGEAPAPAPAPAGVRQAATPPPVAGNEDAVVAPAPADAGVAPMEQD